VKGNSTARQPTISESRRSRYKRPFDLSVLVATHVVLSPLWLLLWTLIPILIWLWDRGPVFYKQKRVGKHGRVFTILKFRTMVPDSDRKGPAWTTEGDPRVTGIGKILRRTALDELPEVLSIWNGDMSLVGPRALDIEEQKILEQEIPGFAQRLRVTPGLTGLAQIQDRIDNGHDKVRFDLEYIADMSIGLDLKLLFLSVRNTLLARWDRRDGKQLYGDPRTASHATDSQDPDAQARDKESSLRT